MQEIADREGIAQFTSASSQQHRIFSKATSAKSRKAKDDFFFFFFCLFWFAFLFFLFGFCFNFDCVILIFFFLKRHLVEAKIRPNNQQKIERNLKLKSLNWLSWHQNNSEETVQAHRGVICNKLSEKVNRIRKIWRGTNYTQLKLKNIGEIFHVTLFQFVWIEAKVCPFRYRTFRDELFCFPYPWSLKGECTEFGPFVLRLICKLVVKEHRKNHRKVCET